MFAAIMWRQLARLVLALALCLGGLAGVSCPWDAARAQQVTMPQSDAITRALPGLRLVLAPSSHQTENVLTTLISSRESVEPGERFWVGLRQRIRAGWHTYWENPGDSGLPMQLDWTLPAGAQAGTIQWPAPRRFPVGPLMNYGYADEVLLLVEMTAPVLGRAGERLDLQVDASWLVCAEICIPEEARLGLGLALGPTVASRDAAALDAARAALPPPGPWRAVHAARDGRLHLRIDMGAIDSKAIREAYFFPRSPGVIDHAAPQRLTAAAVGLTLTMVKATPRPEQPPAEELEGLLAVVERTGSGDARTVFAVRAPPGAIDVPAADSLAAAALPWWQALVFALLGGVILNFMPCVFPVLSMKALALLGGHAGDPRHRRDEAVGYALGVVTTFAAIGAVLLGLRGAGQELGWGFQFQSPIFVALLGYVMLAVGLNLSGVFDVRGAAVSTGASSRRGFAGAFLTGLLAVVVATPCTAPFMAAAVGVALTADALTMFAILLALGIGFAVPFVLIALTPEIARRLPRPGNWMTTLRQFLAFPMYATAAWLLWVLSQQVAPPAFAVALAGCVCVGLAAWLYGLAGDPQKRWPRVVGLGALILAVGLAVQLETSPPPTAAASGSGAGAAGSDVSGLASEPFTPDRLARLRADGRTVFVNMTAAWCITCLFNERSTLSSTRVHAAFDGGKVAYLKGDWTNRDPTITAFLQRFSRSGVPLYVVYRPGREPAVLPQILTESAVLDAVGGGSG